MIFKTDISRTFRHIRIDPGDIDLLGIQHNDTYIDTSSLGFCHGSTFFQHCSKLYVTSCFNMVFHISGII